MRVYLDHNSTTPLHPRALEEMRKILERDFGNPSSIHREGQQARRALDRARMRVAGFIGATPEEIVFTSGGPESIDLGIRGVAGIHSKSPGHVVTSSVEHQSVLSTCLCLEQSGWRVTRVGVDGEGMCNARSAAAAIGDDTRLVSVMLANNEVGTLQPVREIAAAARERGVVCHSDAVQALGKIPVDVQGLGVDLLSLSAHKLGGPKGAGALYVRRGLELAPRLHGGLQESGRRAGTENLPGIVAFGMACELARQQFEDHTRLMATLRDRFERELHERVEGISTNGAGAERLPNTSNIMFSGLDGEALLMNLDLMGVAASSASACTAGRDERSHVLQAMGLTDEQTLSSLRFSFGPTNDDDDVTRAIEVIAELVGRLRSCEDAHD